MKYLLLLVASPDDESVHFMLGGSGSSKSRSVSPPHSDPASSSTQDSIKLVDDDVSETSLLFY